MHVPKTFFSCIWNLTTERGSKPPYTSGFSYARTWDVLLMNISSCRWAKVKILLCLRVPLCTYLRCSSHVNIILPLRDSSRPRCAHEFFCAHTSDVVIMYRLSHHWDSVNNVVAFSNHVCVYLRHPSHVNYRLSIERASGSCWNL